jgi:hypothetical protein
MLSGTACCGFLIYTFDCSNRLVVECGAVQKLEQVTPHVPVALQTDTTEQCGWPFDVLCTIFSFLHPTTFAISSIVCRNWYEASLNEFLFREFVVRRFGHTLVLRLEALRWSRWRDYFFTFTFPCWQYNGEYSHFVDFLPATDARYAVYKFADRPSSPKLLLVVAWIPSDAPWFRKGQFAICTPAVCGTSFETIPLILRASDKSELALDNVCWRFSLDFVA